MTEIAKEYGTALFMLACEAGEQKRYAEILEEIKEIFLKNPQYVGLLSSPAIALTERLSIIDEGFTQVAPEYILSYLKLLCERGRIECFVESVDEYKALLDASEHVYSAKITSAVELTDEEKGKLTDKLESKYKGKIRSEYFIDSRLIGGIIVEVDGTIMDGSLRRRLQQVKEVIK